MSDEEDWSPPSEAELKVIQAKRERSDKISKLMGDYLLKVIFFWFCLVLQPLFLDMVYTAFSMCYSV